MITAIAEAEDLELTQIAPATWQRARGMTSKLDRARLETVMRAVMSMDCRREVACIKPALREHAIDAAAIALCSAHGIGDVIRSRS